MSVIIWMPADFNTEL
uniref:Uncharacterized protein n=1 Tax=Anguilla anguilla TaxID=7936 RepID=A0A0E9R2Q1_ANGAN